MSGLEGVSSRRLGARTTWYLAPWPPGPPPLPPDLCPTPAVINPVIPPPPPQTWTCPPPRRIHRQNNSNIQLWFYFSPCNRRKSPSATNCLLPLILSEGLKIVETYFFLLCNNWLWKNLFLFSLLLLWLFVSTWYLIGYTKSYLALKYIKYKVL